jgi:sugar phosphate permease
MTAWSDEFGWRDGWRAMAAVSVLLLVPVSFLMRRRPEDHGLLPDGVKPGGAEAEAEADADYANSFTRGEALRTSTLYLVILAFGLAVIGVFVVLSQTIPFLTDAAFSRPTAALMSSLMSLPALVSKPLWGLAVERVNPKPMAAAGFAISALAMLIILGAARTESTPLVASGYFLMGAGIGGQVPIQEVIWASYFGRRHLGAIRGVAMPFSLGIGAGAPLAVAAYFDAVGNYDGAFLAVAVLWAASAVLVMLVRRPVRQGPLRE